MKNKVDGYCQNLVNKFGYRRARSVFILLAIGLTALFIHLLFIGGLGQSALLYMLVPYSLSVMVAMVRPYNESNDIWVNYLKHLTTASVIFLATSIVLREGFICVLFFFPIYVFFVSLAYLIRASLVRKKLKNKSLYSTAVPLLVLLMSMEGTTESLSFSRETQVEVTHVTSLSIDEVKQNLATSFDLETERHWLLSVFPMPYQIDAGSLNVGDVHTIKTRYKRWFVTNTHEGQAQLRIEHVGPYKIKTKFLNDTTYFSSYLKVHGTEINLTPLKSGRTKIALRIDYQRSLDPAWYFHPLQKFGVSKMAEYLIERIMIRSQ